MKPKPLTEQQAWLVLATVFESRYGLCWAIAGLAQRGLVSEEMRKRMIAVIDAQLTAGNVYLFPMKYADYDAKRVKFAEKQARKKE